MYTCIVCCRDIGICRHITWFYLYFQQDDITIHLSWTEEFGCLLIWKRAGEFEFKFGLNWKVFEVYIFFKNAWVCYSSILHDVLQETNHMWFPIVFWSLSLFVTLQKIIRYTKSIVNNIVYVASFINDQWNEIANYWAELAVALVYDLIKTMLMFLQSVPILYHHIFDPDIFWPETL